MNIKYNLDELKEIMWSFYKVFGIRFVLMDTDYRKIISYPDENCPFCSTIRKCPSTLKKCLHSDKKSLEQCKKNEGVIVYKCHAGLVEAALALRHNDSIVGYLMFGQVTDNNNSEYVIKMLADYCAENNIQVDNSSAEIFNIRYIDNEQILAAAKIMEACTSYIMLKELITPDNDKIFIDAKEYIENHLSEEIDVNSICCHMKISRTKLYEIFKMETGVGISEYIRKRRMKKAKNMLKTTALPVWEIAQAVGFSDYTYFIRVYKKTYGVAPGAYRKQKKTDK